MTSLTLYGFLLAIGLLVIAWFVFVAPTERRYHARKLEILQQRIAEREARQSGVVGAGPVADAMGPRPSVLETERLVLREMTLDDAGFLVALMNDADFIRYIGDRSVRSDADARCYLQNGPLDSYRRHGYGMYRVEQRSDGAVTGICGLVRRDGLDAPDIGFAFLAAYRERGYATEATIAVLRYAHESLALRRVLAVATPDNVASNKLLVHIGMAPECSMRLPGDDTDLNLYVSETQE